MLELHVVVAEQAQSGVGREAVHHLSFKLEQNRVVDLLTALAEKAHGRNVAGADERSRVGNGEPVPAPLLVVLDHGRPG